LNGGDIILEADDGEVGIGHALRILGAILARKEGKRGLREPT
jgi:hypothetical protein